jgi:FkbM family methyltransferase
MSKIGIDCGANIGSITEKLLEECDEVHAFEPNPHAFKELKKRFLFNPRVICYENAVLEKKDNVRLYFHKNSHKNEVLWSTGSSLLNFKGNVLKDKYIEVEAIDLCKFIEDLGSSIEVLKIDIEGSEYEILHKLIDTGLIYKIKQVHVELHAKKIPELEDKENKIKQRIKDLELDHININWV